MNLPHQLQNGPGNIPDADQYMANWEYAQIAFSQNQLRQPSFEDWNGPTSFAAFVNNQVVLKPWYAEIGGTAAPTATVAQETTVVKRPSTNSVKVTITAAGGADAYVRIVQKLKLPPSRIGFAYSLAFGGHIRTDQALKVRISCADNSSTNYTSYHSGVSQWEKLTGMLQMATVSGDYTLKIEIVADFAGSVYLDNFFAYLVPTTIPTESLEALDYRPGMLEIHDLYIDQIRALGYRRPVLQFNSVTTVDVENNTGTSHETVVIFPDGDVRAVTENLTGTNKYRRFDITATAALTGTHDSGLRSGLSESNNTWYAIYAVKVRDDLDKFVLVGDTVFPTVGNISTLNTNFGAYGWVYLGMIRNGDNSAVAGDILNFVQTADKTYFRNTATTDRSGTLLASTAGATTLTYTYAAGGGAAQIPDHIKVVEIDASIAAAATTRFDLHDSGAARRQLSIPTNSQIVVARVELAAAEGLRASNSAGASVAYSMHMRSFVDGVLGTPHPYV